MSNQLQPQSSLSRKRFSREGFQPIPSAQNGNMAPNDATIDIPLEQVPTSTSYNGGGLRNQRSMASLRIPNSNRYEPEPEKQSSGLLGRGRRAKKTDRIRHVGTDGEEDHVTTMGKIYNKILNFSIITRYFVYVLPLAIILAVPIIVGAIIQSNNPENPPILAGVPLVWFFTWIEIVWLSLWVSKIVAHFMPWLFQLFVGVVSSGVRKYATVIRALEIPLSLVGWAICSLATFAPVMTKNPWNRKEEVGHINGLQNWQKIVQEVLGAFVACSLVFLGERLFIQLLTINYHHKQFNSRIKDSKHNILLLGLMYDASRALFPQYCDEFADEDYIINDQLQLALLGGKKKQHGHAHRRSGSATPLRLIQDIGRVGDKVTSAFGHVAHEITGKEMFNPNSSHSIVVEALERKRTSEALARRIWMSFVVEGRDALVQEDIVDVLGEQHKAEAEECFWALDRDSNGDVSLDEMILTVTEWGHERKALANSMVDVAQAINVLDRMLVTVVLVAVIFIFVAFLNRNFVTTLATAGTTLLSLSFVFSVSAQEVLGSCIFLFVKHPFDIGDRVDIGADQYYVEHISLLFTVFRRATGPKTGQLNQYPNIVLNTLALENVSRSKAQTEQITLNISFNTTFEDIQLLKNEIRKFVTDKDNSRDFQSEFAVEVLGTTNMSDLQLKIEIKHKSNWSNEMIRATRRSKFMCALVAALRAVPIYAPGGGTDVAGSAANPNYSVAITDEQAKHNATTSAETRDSARLIPAKMMKELEQENHMSPTLNKPSGFAGLTVRDLQAVDDINFRKPADIARDDTWGSRGDDSSTLDERASQADLDEVRGLLRRESSKGKRKPSMEGSRPYQPSVPTIQEPTAYGGYATQQQPSSSTYGVQASPYVNTVTAYNSQYQPTQLQGPSSSNNNNIEMSQIGRSDSQTYRTRSESVSRKPFSPMQRHAESEKEDEDENDEFGDTRPYSGV